MYFPHPMFLIFITIKFNRQTGCILENKDFSLVIYPHLFLITEIYTNFNLEYKYCLIKTRTTTINLCTVDAI